MIQTVVLFTKEEQDSKWLGICGIDISDGVLTVV